MSRVKLVVVPRWLVRVAKENSIADKDLIDLEKLRGILSRRDVDLYQMAQARLGEIVCFVESIPSEQGVLFNEYGSPIPRLDIEVAANYQDLGLSDLIYGATATHQGEGVDTKYGFSAVWTDQDTVLLKVVDDATSGVVEATARRMHEVLSFPEAVRTAVFKQYVRNLEINPIG